MPFFYIFISFIYPPLLVSISQQWLQSSFKPLFTALTADVLNNQFFTQLQY
jgi:hypothetical protein